MSLKRLIIENGAKALTTVMITGCVEGPAGYHVDSNGLKVPNRWSGQIAPPSQWTATSAVLYDKLYLYPFTDTDGERKVFVQKFWATGRMCQWKALPNEIEHSVEVHLPRDSSVGRFMIKGSQPTVETVGVDEGGARFIRETAEINPDGSISYFMGSRVGAFKSKLTYRPLAAKLSPQTADW